MPEQVAAQLPDEVTEFLNSSELLLKVFEILEKYKVDEDLSSGIVELIEGVVKQQIKLEDLPAGLAKITGLDPTAATKLAADLAGHWLLPIEAYVGDVTGQIMSWGGKVEDYPPKRIARRAVQPDEFVRETLQVLGATLKDATLQHRLEYILSSYVRGVRTAEETIAVLGRSRKVGGLEMDAVKAKQLVEHIGKKMELVKIDRGPEVKKVPPTKGEAGSRQVTAGGKIKKETKQKPPTTPTQPTGMSLASEEVPTGKFDAVTISKADEIEVQAAAKKLNRQPQSGLPTKENAAGLVAGIKINLPNEESKKRFANIVNSRLRGIRDALETRDSLEADPAQGGLGLKGKEMADAMDQIERQFDLVEGKLKEDQATGKQNLILRNREKASQQGKIARAEADIMAKRYASITGKAPKELLAPAAPTGSRVSAARGSEAELQAAAARIDQDKVKRVVQAAKQPPAAATAELSEASVTGTGKPKVQDVTSAQRLAGPVDELANLDPTSFRRLSADPKEAILKIKDKIDLLEGESYAKRLAGIKAWQENPINQLYLSLVREALTSGQAIKDIANKKTMANEPSLSADEIKSIMQLNKQLKF